MKNRAVFLDRDNVINEFVERDGNFTSPWKIGELVYKPKVQEAVAKLRNLRYKILVITNQPGVYYGDMSVYDLVDICYNVKSYIRADEVYPCIFPSDTDICDEEMDNREYKPGCGAILKLMNKYNIDPKQSFMIGDRWKDIVAGYRAKLTTIYVNKEKYVYPYRFKHIQPDFHKTDLMAAVEQIEFIINLKG